MEIERKTGLQFDIGVNFDRREAARRMPQTTKRPAPDPLLLGFAPLHRTAMGVALGVVLGALIFLLTCLALPRGHSTMNPGLLAQFFPGYGVSTSGAFVGLLWGFGVGFILGWGFAWLRNLAVRVYLRAMRSRAEIEQYGDFLDHF
jgi:hypothetical protein